LNGLVSEDTIKAFINGVEHDSIRYTHKFSKIIQLEMGSNLIEIEAQDNAGNVSFFTINIKRE
jgi:hypothetical protein